MTENREQGIGNRPNKEQRVAPPFCRRFPLFPIPCSLFVVLLFVGLASAQTSDQTQKRSAEQLLQQADQALQKQDYVSAAQALEPYLVQKPDDYRAEFNLAYAYSLTGRRAEAISRYQSVLSRQPELASAHLNLGILLLQEGHPEEAEGHLRAVLKQEPDNLNANMNLATALASLKRLPEASEAYERVLKLKPDDARVHMAYGELLQESNPAAAEEHLRRAVQIDPSLEKAWLHLAALLTARAGANAESLREAAEIYRHYLEKHPERRELRISLGEIHASQKQFAAAAVEFEAARAAGDSSPSLAKELLQVYLNGADIGDREPGTENREKLQAHLENPDARKAGGEDEKAKYTDKAIALVLEILAQDSRNAEMHLLSGRLQLGRKQYQAAAEEFRQVTELQPQSAEGYTNLASALYLSGDYEAAVGALGKVSALQRDTPGTYFLRAICLDKLHIRKPALENYQHFLAVDGGKNQDQEWQARQRSKLLAREIEKGMGSGKKPKKQ